MFGNQSTRQIVTNKRPKEDGQGAEAMVHGRSVTPSEPDDTALPEVEETATPSQRKLPSLPKWLNPIFFAIASVAMLLFVVLIISYPDSPTAPVVSDGQAVVAVPADSMLTNEVEAGDIVRLYNNDGVLMEELQYVQVYGTEAGGLLLLMDEKQAAVMVSQKDAPKVVLVTHNDSEQAAELLDLQARINDPQIALGLQPSITMMVDETQEPEFQASITPSEASLPKVQWTTSDPSVATVEEGIITATGIGEAMITAFCGNAVATCAVTVEIPLKAIVLSKTEAAVAVGETISLEAAADPEDTTRFDIIWSTEDPAVATVAADGTVTGVAAGTTNITASSGDITASCAITVGVHAEVVQLEKAALTLEAGESATLKATVYPSTGVIDKASYESSDTSVATVDAEGKVTAYVPGSTTITYRCGEATATCTVEVIVPDLSPSE